MKRFAAFLMVALASFTMGTFCLPIPAKQDATTNGSDAEFRDLKCKSLSLTSGDGKHTIRLTSWDRGVGIWVSHEGSGENVAIVSLNGQNPYVGLIGKNDNGCPFALGRDDEKVPFIQLINKEKYRWLKVEDLMAMPNGFSKP